MTSALAIFGLCRQRIFCCWLKGAVRESPLSNAVVIVVNFRTFCLRQFSKRCGKLLEFCAYYSFPQRGNFHSPAIKNPTPDLLSQKIKNRGAARGWFLGVFFGNERGASVYLLWKEGRGLFKKFLSSVPFLISHFYYINRRQIYYVTKLVIGNAI